MSLRDFVHFAVAPLLPAIPSGSGGYVKIVADFHFDGAIPLKMTAEDRELLRDYAQQHSEEAFAGLVQRHLNLVYSAALRQVRSAQLAEEVAQSVSTDLARAAERLKPDTIITAPTLTSSGPSEINCIVEQARMRMLVFVLMAGVWIAFGDPVPLGTWVTSRTGPGTASVSVLATDHIYITVGNVQSGPNSTWGYATSETNLLTITPNTTYMLSSVCSVSGPGSGTMALLADGTSVASVLLVSAATSNRWISFTTGESGDSRVGQGLKVQMVAGSGFPGGGANADFASIKVATFGARPSLTLRRLSSTQLQLSWPVVFDGFIPEHASTPDGGVWQTVTNSVTTQGNENAVTIDTSGASRYFRLHKP